MTYKHTEWWDEGEPELKFGQPMDDEHVDMAYSQLYPGCRVRWTTPAFVKRGAVVKKQKRSLVVMFDDHTKTTAIPDAKWYFVEGKLGNKQEHLVAINTEAKTVQRPKSVDNDASMVTPAQAANILGTDPKHIRRMIRSGKLKAHREGGRWLISRGDLA